MKAWRERPIEEAHLLNPAFCCAAVTSSVIGYTSVENEGMPFPLAFMILPIVLHKPTRDLLPRDIRTSLPAWIQDNTSVRILFYERAILMRQYTREALIFGSIYNWLTFQEKGNVKPLINADKTFKKLQDEARECVSRAGFLGKWFALAGSAETVMTLWGIRP